MPFYVWRSSAAESLAHEQSLLQRAVDEVATLDLMSFHGVPWGYAADLNEDDVRKIRALIGDLARALADATGTPVPAPGLVL